MKTNYIKELRYYIKNQVYSNKELIEFMQRLKKENDLEHIKEEISCFYFLTDSFEIREELEECARILDYKIM